VFFVVALHIASSVVENNVVADKVGDFSTHQHKNVITTIVATIAISVQDKKLRTAASKQVLSLEV
jgi:hypothetical protein